MSDTTHKQLDSWGVSAKGRTSGNTAGSTDPQTREASEARTGEDEKLLLHEERRGRTKCRVPTENSLRRCVGQACMLRGGESTKMRRGGLSEDSFSFSVSVHLRGALQLSIFLV